MASDKRTDVLALRVTSAMLQRWQDAARARGETLHAWAESSLDRAATRGVSAVMSPEAAERLLALVNGFDPT